MNQGFSVPLLRDRYGKVALDGTDIRRRFPHLIRAAQYVAILAQSEAVSALFDARLGIRGGCEAVSHFGGSLRVIQEAWRTRSTARKLGYLADAKALVTR
jgi:hypothetical protein